MIYYSSFGGYTLKKLLYFFLLLVFACNNNPVSNRSLTPSDKYTLIKDLPHQWIIQKLKTQDEFTLVDLPGYNESLDWLMAFLPLLHQQHYYQLDLWFINDELIDQFQSLLQQEYFDEEAITLTLMSENAFWIQQRNIDLLKYIHNFNQQLDEDEQPFVLAGENISGDSLFYLNLPGDNQHADLIIYRKPINDNDLFLDPALIQNLDQHIISLTRGDEESYWLYLTNLENYTPSSFDIKRIKKKNLPLLREQFAYINKNNRDFFLTYRIKKEIKRNLYLWY
jgi:hypothetical protein